MADLLVLIMSVLVSGAALAFLAPRSRWWRLAAIPLYMLSLGLALRLCGRTYPGLYDPHSALLNALLNGNGLFTEVGYDLVALLGLLDATFVYLLWFRPPDSPSIVVISLRWSRPVVLLAIVAIIAYGVYWAIEFQRLPGAPYD